MLKQLFEKNSSLSRILFFVALLLMLAGGSLSVQAQATVTWDLNTLYGVSPTATDNQTRINQAILDAIAYFSSYPADTLILQIDAGTYTINNEQANTTGFLIFTNVNPTGGGRLVFQGAGHNSTVLAFNHFVSGQSYPTACLHGNRASHITIQSMQLTTVNMTVTQGIVVSVSPGVVVLDIQPGFPSPQDIFDPNVLSAGGGRFLRKYDNTNPLDPHIVDNDVWPPPTMSRQVSWDSPTQISDERWQLNLTNPSQVAPYSPGDLVGIKSKHGAFSYWFGAGTDFVFNDILWTRESRGTWRNGYDNITVQNSFINRDPPINGQTPCLSTPDGGPQLGQPTDPPLYTVTIANNNFVAPGDDIVAFFNVNGGIIQNNYLADGFTRLLLYSSPNPQLIWNTILRTPIYVTP